MLCGSIVQIALRLKIADTDRINVYKKSGDLGSRQGGAIQPYLEIKHHAWWS
jgi:hypothetical protein